MNKLALILMLVLLAVPMVYAADFDDEIDDDDKATFDQILEPVMRVYNFVKYTATVLAVVFLVFAGISFVASGSNPKQREQSKAMIMYIVIGLIVIWAAPLVVQYLLG